MLTTKRSPTKTPTSVFPSPARAKPAVDQAEADTERYLYEAVAVSFENSGDMWHLFTTFPDNFAARCKNLGALLETHKAEVKRKLKDKQKYERLADDILESICGSNGAYYTYAAREESRLAVPTRHMGQLIIHERKTGQFTNGIDHAPKAYNLASTLDDLLERLEAICDVQCSSRADPLLDEAELFVDYIKLQIQCLAQALNYDPRVVAAMISAMVEAGTELVLDPLSLTVQKWHRSPLKQTTPAKATPSCRKIKQEYQEYVQSKKAAKIGWTREDTKAVAQEWQSAMLSKHKSAYATDTEMLDLDTGFGFSSCSSPDKSAAATTSAPVAVDEDLGFDFSGWSSPDKTTASPAGAMGALSIQNSSAASSSSSRATRTLFQG